MEGVPGQPLELREPHLGHTPEAFDAVNVDAATRELILGMVDAKEPVYEVDQAVITAPAVHFPAGDLHRRSAGRRPDHYGPYHNNK